jgi:hypothetical protein
MIAWSCPSLEVLNAGGLRREAAHYVEKVDEFQNISIAALKRETANVSKTFDASAIT